MTTDSSPDNVLAGSVTMMIEPTESKSKAELDRFCDALISIYRGNSRDQDRGSGY